MTTECVCTGQPPLCVPCLLAMAVQMRQAHPDTLSISMLKRRIPDIRDGREAWLLLEATRGMMRYGLRDRLKSKNGTYVKQ